MSATRCVAQDTGKFSLVSGFQNGLYVLGKANYNYGAAGAPAWDSAGTHHHENRSPTHSAE